MTNGFHEAIGDVSVTYHSGECLYANVYARHGTASLQQYPSFDTLLREMISRGGRIGYSVETESK